MHFIRPFEAAFECKPQISQRPWPSYFHISEQTQAEIVHLEQDPFAEGISQDWSMSAEITSFASHVLIIESIELQVQAIHEKAVCRISHNPANTSEPITLSPSNIHSRTFNLDLQKLSLDDRLTTYFNLELTLTWRRDFPSSPSATVLLPAPELVIPFGEPRVLASIEPGTSKPSLVNLHYTIENPSMHVLSFSVSMDASEDFAFSGPKATAVQLIPLSRYSITYRLLPFVRGKWISPQIKVLDVHWNKLLKPIATGDLKNDRRGVLIWVDVGD